MSKPNSIIEIAASVDYADWATDKGELLPQSTTVSTIHRMLCLLDIHHGMRILEIGTGSGYSGALLSRLTGDRGRVISLDVDTKLISRAQHKHKQASHNNIELHNADGFQGWPSCEPFDRIISWATPPVVPKAWIAQAKPGAVIVTPIKVAPIAGANAVLQFTLDRKPAKGNLYPGSFIDMAPQIVTEFALPVHYLDAVSQDLNGLSWLSGQALRNLNPTIAQHLLGLFNAAIPSQLGNSLTYAQWQEFNIFLLATSKNSGSAYGENGLGLGIITSDSIATLFSTGKIISAGTSLARGELIEIYTSWEKLGRPGYSDLAVSFTEHNQGWQVHPQYS